MPKIFGIKNCDTMKRAFAWFDAAGVAYEFIDYKKSGIVASHLDQWNRRAGWQVLLNTRGLTWRKLGADERSEVDEDKALALMRRYPTLIKRPLVDDGERLLVGFDAELYARHFGHE